MLNIRLRTSIFFFFVVLANSVFAQASLDELLKESDSLLFSGNIVEAKAVLDQVEVMYPEAGWRLDKGWGDYYLNQQQFPLAASYYSRLFDAEIPNEKVPTIAFGRALNDLGIAYYEMGNLDSAVIAHERSLEIYKSIEERQGEAYNYTNLANIAKQRSELEQALEYYQLGLEAIQAIKDTLGMGFTTLNMAILYRDSDQVVKAMDYVQQSIRYFGMIGRVDLQMTSRRILSIIYASIEDFESAKPLLMATLEYYQEQNKPRDLARSYRQLINIYRSTQQFDSASWAGHRALQLYSEIESNLGMAGVYVLLGALYVETEALDSAEFYYDATVQLSAGEFTGNEATAHFGLGKIALLRGQYAAAIRESKLGLELINNNFNLGDNISVYETLYEAFKALGQQSQALLYLESKTEALEAASDRKTSLELARLEYRNQLERDEALRVAEQERERLILQQRINRQRWIIFSSLGGSLLIALLLVNIIRSYRQKQRDNEQLQLQNATIENQNEELRAINEKLKESHERETQLLQESIASKDRELSSVALVNHEKNSILEALTNKLEALQGHLSNEGKTELRTIKKTISSNLNLSQSWDTFFQHFQDVHPTFFDALKQQYPRLTNNDLKLSAYLKIGMSNKEIASMTNLEVDSVKRSINRLKKKIGLPPEQNLRDYLLRYTGENQIT
ncbi:MAG TPA: hypothetical protein DCE41_10600 [Cytophagales bacterium]|nr:hypothetical protein [Cytophagales bacterium]HAA21662.1 hypothetical protein [Cytophagales bacterium]HAP63723.1 hypothetical protein [Cytophagales bacterium]